MNNIVLDTNFIFSLLVSHQPNHKEALNTFSQIDKNKIIIPFVVVAELVIAEEHIDFLAVCKKLSKFRIVDSIEDDLNFVSKEIDFLSRRVLKSNDCLILAICKRYNAKLITLDKKLQRAYAKLIFGI